MVLHQRTTTKGFSAPATTPGEQVVGAARKVPPSGERILDVELAADPQLIGTARRQVGELFDDGDEALRDSLVLCTSELVTNATLHTRAEHIHIAVETSPSGICLQVSDPSTTPPRLVPGALGDPARVDGRGLAIVATLSRDWGFCACAGAGKTVWCSFLPSGAGGPRGW